MNHLAGNFDTPQSWTQKRGIVRFSGWCCHPQHRIEKLRLGIDNRVIDCNYGLAREDIAQAYPGDPYSGRSGFEVSVPITPGSWKVALHALLETGETVQFAVEHRLIIERPPFLQRFGDTAREVIRFARFLRERVRADRRSRDGRLPPIRELPALAGRAINFYRERRWLALEFTRRPQFAMPGAVAPYDAWLRVNRWNQRTQRHLEGRLAARQDELPRISVVMPVFGPPIRFLETAIKSVVGQVYGNWELCIAADCSTNANVRTVLKRWAERDRRIRVHFRKENGHISRATNDAAGLATGEFLVFLDHDDELTPDALAEVALYLSDNPKTDILYSDDDRVDADGRRYDPQFKPDWSPELLLSYMYMSHVLVVGRALFDQVGGLRTGFEGSQDYDFALRATEKARRIGHLPLVLYHWRALPGSTARSTTDELASIAAGRRAVQGAVDRRGIQARVYQPEWAAEAGVGIFTHQFPDDGPSVAIIIPTKNRLELLRGCLESLGKTSYRNYEVVIVDSDSDDPDTSAYLSRLRHKVLRVATAWGRFNFAAINNEAVSRVEAEYVLFLNDDTEVVRPDWLSQMMGYAQINGVGAVGARLLYADGRIQHAGIVHGFYHGMAGPAFKLLPRSDYGYLSYANVARNCSAVTAACLLTPRQLFVNLGGFDEDRLGVAYDDVDYCYRLVDKGYRCVYAPGAELIHREGASRGFADHPAELATFRRKYAERRDPWYSPHLSLTNEQFRIQPRRIVVGMLEPIRTLMCAFNLNWEGAPYSQFELTVALKEKGVIAPIVYCPNDGPLREAYENHGIEVRVAPHPLLGVFTLAHYEERIEKFVDFVRSNGVRLLYGNTRQTFYAIDAAHRAGIPSIWNPRESEPWRTYFEQFPPAIAARAPACFQYPYRVIFVSDATRDTCLELNGHHNSMVIHTGLDVARLRNAATAWPRPRAREALGVGPQDVVLLLLGTVCERKGQHDLANALAQMGAELYGRIQCFIVGDRPSPYGKHLRVLVGRLPERLRERVHVVPETPQTAKYYQAADVFVCTSRVESYPRVTLEAMAHALPIVTTPVYGINEQVQNEINGLFYEPANTKQLMEQLSRVVADGDLRSRLAANSTHVLNTLNSFEDMVAAYAEVLREAYLSGSAHDQARD